MEIFYEALKKEEVLEALGERAQNQRTTLHEKIKDYKTEKTLQNSSSNNEGLQPEANTKSQGHDAIQEFE